MLPRARREHLTVHELPDETLVYDRERHKGHCLNAMTALIWGNCDGKTSVDDLVRIVARDTGIDPAAELVSLALEQLGRRNLLEESPPPLSPAERISRRVALKKLAVAAAVLPLIMSVATKTAAQSLSGGDSDPPPSPPPPPAVNVNVSANVNVNVGSPGNRQSQPPCRSKGQSCVASASGQQGTCCGGLLCNGVSQNAGVCG
jgi:hypothetical protein